MPVHLLRAKPLVEELASDAVSARDQAVYFAASCVLWLLPGYLFIMPAPNFDAWSVPFGLWFYELFALGAVYVLGTFNCLSQCRVDPRRNFLIDLSCLYVPVSLTTLIAVWAIFHVYAWLIPWWLTSLTFANRPPYAIELLYSARVFDLLRFLAVVGGVFIVFMRVARHMDRVSELRGG